MSWNGATGITSWEVFAGDNDTDLQPVGTVKSMGFETMLQIGDSGDVVKVAAFRDGVLLRNSTVVAVA